MENLKIGILTYHHACNFGANLQTLSTVGFLKKNNIVPIVINWVPEDLENYYKNVTPEEQFDSHQHFSKNYLPLSELCRSDEDIVRIIKNEDIKGIIVGSDAVVKHISLLSRIIFPTSHIYSIINPTSDRLFPNPFWGSFYSKLEVKIPLIMMSVSSQNANYKKFLPSEKKIMHSALSNFKLITVRDAWTKKMMQYLTNNEITTTITPDPVFAFNHNIKNQITQDEILEKFGITKKYLLFSFHDNKTVSQKWLSEIEKLAINKKYECIALTMPSGLRFNHPFNKEIKVPLSPLEWYGLIKYSNGYIGHNMHPIIVALHNAVPFFSFDNYGINLFRVFPNHKSSKIYHILKESSFLNHRIYSASLFYRKPSAENVFNKLINFDKEKCIKFNQKYFEKYQHMMNNILKSLQV